MDPSSSTESGIALYLLGGFEVRSTGKVVRLETAKTNALLAYLALQDKPQTRHKLMGLFWGNLPEASARSNLRHALYHIRFALNDPDRPPPVFAAQQTIAFNRATDYWLDVEAFEHLLQREAVLIDEALSVNRLTLLRDALDLYRGDLLEGVYLENAPAFEEWLLVERERLRGHALQLLQRLVELSIGWGEYPTGIDYARRLIAMEPWQEEAHRQMMRLLALAGQRSQALAQYETSRRVLAEELNTEPSPETQALYESIRVSAEETRPPSPSSTPHQLPVQTTPFVGREEELVKLAGLLNDPSCRLLTLVGPGGIGKTRLALRAAAGAEAFQDGVFFIPLAAVGSVDLIIPILADTLGYRFHGGENPEAQLVTYLREKEMLLLMDNFEHLLSGVEFLVRILETAPRVKILVTTRERLNLRAEWLFPVEGLEYPKGNVPKGSSLEAYSAVQLFVQAARRAQFGFALTKADSPFVAHFCQMVAGMPLAIELAANWTRVLSCEQIIRQIEVGLDWLNTTQRDVPARHRSLRAVFDQSWQYLAEDERQVFKYLSIFHNGFRLEGAEPVAGASHLLLASLVDKSFLWKTPSGRFEMHELIRQYGDEHISAEERLSLGDRHCAYFTDFLHQREEMINGPRKKEILNEIAAEIENIRAAWDWAINRQMVEEIDRALQTLYIFYDSRGLQREAIGCFQRAAEQLGGVQSMFADPVTDRSQVALRLIARQAYLFDRLSLWEQGIDLAVRCLNAARRLGNRREIVFLLHALGACTSAIGKTAESERFYMEELELQKELKDRRGEASALMCLGDLAREKGNYAEAKQFLVESMAVSDQIGNNEIHAYALLPLGYIECELSEFDEAKQHGAQALAIFETLSNPTMTPLALCVLGQAAAGRGEDAEARKDYLSAIAIAASNQEHYQLLEALSWLAILLSRQGELEKAEELAAFILHHPAINQEINQHMLQLTARLATQLTPNTVLAAQAKGKMIPLEQLIEEIAN